MSRPTADEIDDRIDAWNAAPPDAPFVPLHDVLGWTAEEFERWVRDPEAVPDRPLPAWTQRRPMTRPAVTPNAEESAMQHYVIRMRDTSYAVVGPFETQAAAAEWGQRDQDHGGDDPRWQVIQLADPHVVRVVHPNWTSAVAP